MKQTIKEAVLAGNPIIFPTDTVYGLGAIPTKEALDKLYILKKREKNKKIIALVSDVDMIKEITDDIDYNVVNSFMPGPLSIVCNANQRFADLVGPTIGIRIPNSDVARDIIRSCGGILMTTSANISGQESVKDYKNLSKELLDKVNFVIKTENVLSGIPSTVVLYQNSVYTLLREGEIKFEEILKIGGKIIEK